MLRLPILCPLRTLSSLTVKRCFSTSDLKPTSNTMSNNMPNNSPGITPYLLGIFGLVPFVASSVGIFYFPSSLNQLLNLQALYGCSILSFLGAVHWGIAMNSPNSSKRYIVSVLPALLGFSSCLIPHVPVTLIVQGIGFLGLYGYERKLYKANLIPKWYIRLRFGLTAIVLISLTSSIILDDLSNS